MKQPTGRVRLMRRFSAIAMSLLVFSSCQDQPPDDPTSSNARPPNDTQPCRTPPCQVVLTHLAVLSDSADPGTLPDYNLFVERFSTGHLLVAAATRDRVIVYDEAGNYIRSVGRVGDGPGEYSRITSVIVGPGDSVFIHDAMAGRVTVLGPDLEYARAILGLMYAPDLVLAQGQMLIAQQMTSRGESGYPLHLAGPSGALLRSFGADPPEHRRDIRWLSTRIAAPTPDGSVWVAAPGLYELQKWDPDTGRQTATVTIESDWFVGAPAPHADPMRPPQAFISKLWVDPQGLVWVVFQDTDSNWRPPAPDSAYMERPFVSEEYDILYDWIIEVVEPESGQVLAHRRFDRALWVNPRSGLVATKRPLDVRESADVQYDVWQATITPQREVP